MGDIVEEDEFLIPVELISLFICYELFFNKKEV